MARGKRTNVGGDPGQDDLALARVTNSLSEFGVIPSIDLAVPSDHWRLRMHFRDLLGQRPVWARLSAGRQNDGKVEKLGNGGVGDDIVSELGRFIIPDLGSISRLRQ